MNAPHNNNHRNAKKNLSPVKLVRDFKMLVKFPEAGFHLLLVQYKLAGTIILKNALETYIKRSYVYTLQCNDFTCRNPYSWNISKCKYGFYL
jgi:hypothetical protein